MNYCCCNQLEKVKLRLNKLKTWLESSKYSDHIISSVFYKAELQSPASKAKNNFNNIPFVTAFHKDTDNEIIMKNIERKIENTPPDCLKGIFPESNTFLSQRQAKNLLRLLFNSSISRNPSLPEGNFKYSDKRCNICRLYLIESSEFEFNLYSFY